VANYLIAVGGTGQHVALAAADLIALAHEIYTMPDQFPSVHLILVDADQAADTTEPSAWQEARNRLNALGLFDGDSFECTPLPVNSPMADTRRMYEFLNRLGVSFGPNAADALLLREQREVDVTTGFYAQPRVGAMMAEWLFSEVTRGEAVNPKLARIFALAGDPANRIVVAGSGVGGTGAGFAPALVRHLSETAGGASLMALMATEWFRLSGACGSRLSEAVQKSNANSALWHAARSGSDGGARTILFGHPYVSRAPEEECQNGAYQARKKNLTIPYYAAAAAMSFFAGDMSTGTHIPAAAFSGDVVALPKSLRVTQRLTLDDLVQANLEAVGRLTLAAEYLRGRYRGFVLPLSSLSGRISALDTTDLQRLEGPLEAKKAALANLGASDEKLPVTPRSFRGLSSLSGWLNGKVDRPYDLWKNSPVVPAQTTVRKAEAVAADGETAALLIRKIAYAGRVSGGNLVPVTPAQVRDLVAVDDVDVSKVPASDAVALTLGDILATWNARNVEQKNEIAATLVADGHARRPVLISGDRGDRPREWLTRWFLLTNLLLDGKLTVEPNKLPFTTGKVLSFRGVPVGELSDAAVCLPLVNGHWNEETMVEALWGAGSRLEKLATWCWKTKTVARCKVTDLPPWLDILLYVTERFAGTAKQFTTQSVSVRWPGIADPIPLPLPNAAEPFPGAEPADGDVRDCVEATAQAFGVFGPPPERMEMSPAVRGVVDEISEKALTVPSLTGGQAKSVVFSELLSPAARNCLFGDVIVDTGARKAWRLASGSHVVNSVTGELLTENVGCFRTEQRRKWLTPLQREYIPLLASGDVEIRIDEHGQELRVSLTLRGRTFVETYSPSRVREINPLLLQWPSTVAAASASLTVLFDVQERRYGPQTMHVLMHDDAARSWKCSTPLGQRHSLHYIDTGSQVPHSLSFDFENHDVGFIRIERSVQYLEGGQQRMAVDFGTSATVVAVLVPGGTEVLDLLASGSDATAEVWKGNELTAFQWYGTRTVDPTIRQKKRAPSALVFLGSAKDARPSQPRYGDHVLLDQDDWQWTNGDASLMFDIKWTRDRAYREMYLIHHIEQCIAAALSKNLLRSRQLSMIFTMPLRQRARAENFVSEIETVAATLQQRTGIAIEPRFAYESEVIAPEGAPGSDVDAIVIADLGGGTLDLFARYFGKERRKNARNEVFDSARIGGHALVEWLTRNLDVTQLAEYRRRLRLGAGAQLDEESAEMARGYFDVVKRFTALWTDSVWRYWTGGERRGRVHVQLLGMGWSLPCSPGDQMALHLTDIAQSVKSPLVYSRFADAVLGDNPKELLARRAALREGNSKKDFIAFEPASVNGIEVSVAGDVRRDHEPLRGLGASTPAVAITAPGVDRIRQLTGAREEVVAVVRDATRATLTSRSQGLDKYDGAVLEGPNIWVASPLAIAAEMYASRVLLQVNA
jgi:hypothetical protein